MSAENLRDKDPRLLFASGFLYKQKKDQEVFAHFVSIFSCFCTVCNELQLQA